MELTELVSPHIAVPVIGVVVCAIMVFAFGFRSPVQPPSFNFEEEKRSKKRTKQTKSKGSINGLVSANDHVSEAVQKATSKPLKEVKATSSPKQAPASKSAGSPKAELSESKTVGKKELTKDNKGDKKGKSKKEAVKEDVKAEVGKRNKTASAKKDPEDDGEWTTIQVSKKSKKQKPKSKKDRGQAESAVEPESEPENAPTLTSEAAPATSTVLTSEVEEPGSPPASKTKKKDKLSKKNRVEEKEEPQEVPDPEKPESVSNITLNQDQGDSKKKKNKKEKKPSGSSPEDAAASEKVLQDVAASGKDAKKKLNPAPVIPVQLSSETNTEQASGKKKSKGKENIQEGTIVKTADVELKEVKKPVDPVRKEADVQLIEVEKPYKIITAIERKKTKAKSLSKALRVDPEISAAPVPAVESVETAGSAPAEPVPVGISFDEIGDSWQEAAPKSKKKKPRKD